MGEPEHISQPILKCLEVIYQGRNWDAAIERELKRRGLTIEQVRTIICIPEEMADGCSNSSRQKKIFTDFEVRKS
jgi:hypothetical protein